MALCVIVCQLRVAGGGGEVGLLTMCEGVHNRKKDGVTELCHARWNFCHDSCLSVYSCYLSLVLTRIKNKIK